MMHVYRYKSKFVVYARCMCIGIRAEFVVYANNTIAIITDY